MSRSKPRPPVEGRRLPKRGTAALFARIVTADFSCPRCDWTTRLRASDGGGKNGLAIRRGEREKNPVMRTWNPRLSRFHCGQCGLILYLGIVAWPCVERQGDLEQGPPDTVPTLRQALSLRRELSRLAARRRSRGEQVNALGELQEGQADALAWVWRRQAERKRALDAEAEAAEEERLRGERERWRASEPEPEG